MIDDEPSFKSQEEAIRRILENPDDLGQFRKFLLLRSLEDPSTYSSDLRNPEKKRALRRTVRIPAALTEANALGACQSECIACLADVPLPDESRSTMSLTRANGLPYKILLTIFRWAHPYSDNYFWRPDWGTASLSTSDLVAEVMGRANELASEDPENQRKNVRNAIRALSTQGLVWEVRRRREAHSYIPHVLGHPVRMPDTLWRNGWLAALNGSELYLLVHLLARASEDSEYRIPSFRISRLQALGLDERRLREAIRRLTDERLVIQTQTREGRFLVLLQPDMLTKPSTS
jgi:hypothetical protein